MKNLLKSKIENNIIKFEVKIRKNLQLYSFSKDAIISFSKKSKEQFDDYEFKHFLKKFKKINFRQDAEIKNINYKEIPTYGNNLIKNELSNLIFILNISDFEAWLGDFFNLLFLNDHNLFLKFGNKDKDENQIKLFMITESNDIEEIWQKIIDKHLNSKFYKGMPYILDSLLLVCCIKKDKDFEDIIGQINEHCLSRNLIIHNKNKVNIEYIKKAGKYARFNDVGTLIDISEDYLFRQVDNLLYFMQKIRHKIIKSV